MTERPTFPPRYAELHAHSSFSFLDGAATPEELAEEAARLGLRGARPHRPRRRLRRRALRRGGRGARAADRVRRRAVAGRPDCRAPREPSSRTVRPGSASPTRRAATCSCSPATRRLRARCAGRSAAAQLRGGAEGPPVYDRSTSSPTRRGGHWLVLTGCRKGAVRQAPRRAGGPRRRGAGRARPAGRPVRPRQRGRRADDHGSTRSPTSAYDALAALAAERGLPLVATTTSHYATPAAAPAGHRAGRGPGPQQPGRAGRLAAGLAGRPPAQSGPRWPRRFARWPRRGRARGASWPTSRAFRPVAASRRTCRRSRCRDGHTEMTTCASSPTRGAPSARSAGKPPSRCPARTRRSSTSSTIIEAAGFPGYFLVVWDIVEFCREQRHPLPGPRLGRQLRGLLRAAASPPSTPSLRAAVRALPRARARRAAGHRHRHRVRPARGGHPVRLRAARPRARRPGRQRHHLPAASPRCATSPRRSATPPGSRTRGASRSSAGDYWTRETEADTDDDPGPRWSTWPPSCRTLPAAPGHPLRRHGDVRPAGDRGLPGRVGPHARAARVLQWDKDDCAAIGLVKFDLLGLGMLSALHYAVDLVREHHGVDVDLADASRRRTRASTTCSARPTSIGVFQVESPRADGHAAAAAAAHASTTWWSRSR